MADALVAIAREKLIDVVREQLSLFAGAARELQKLSSTFQSIQAVLDDAESRQASEKSVQLWLSRLKHVAYDIEDLVEDGRISGLGDEEGSEGDGNCINKLCSCFPLPYNPWDYVVSRHKIACDIKEIRERLDQIDVEANRFGFKNNTRGGDDTRHVGSQRLTTSLMDESEMFIGRENDKETIIGNLVSGSGHEDRGRVQVVAVVGIGGLGKTTLARQIYNDLGVRKHFDTALYWVCVSDTFDVMRLTKAILEQVKKESTSLLELDALQKELLQALEGKRFLLVLDDVWNDDAEKWNMLRLPLKSRAQGSRILVTTRSQKVANSMNAAFIYELKGLSDDHSWQLFQSRAFAGRKAEEYSKFENVAREIMSKCRGVPLSIKVMGSAMNSKRTMADWQDILDSKMWPLQEAEKEILPALWLSYYNLPPHLKQCFAYCSMFPKDWKLEKDVLVRLWVAQGFIRSEGNRDTVDIGDKYFDELVAWSMFQEIEEYEGKITCKMHDMLHDLAEFIAKDEIYCSKAGKSEESSSSICSVRHAFLCFADSNDEPSEIPIATCRANKLRTLWLDGIVDDGITRAIDEARFLRALYFPSSTTFPKSIGKLKHLRYLHLRGSEIAELPDAIGEMEQLIYLDLSGSRNIVKLPESVSDLHNLQTLSLRRCYRLKKLPRGMSEMVSLRHLEIEGTRSLEYLPKGLGGISGLRSLCKFIVGGGDEAAGCGIEELQRLNSLQGTLVIEHLERVAGREEAEKAELWKKQYLRKLVLEIREKRDDDVKIGMIDILEGLQPHENLGNLELVWGAGSQLPSWMDRMRCLQKLKLYHGPLLEQVPHLPSLKKFYISFLRNKKLPDEGWERLMALQKLKIEFCNELKCLPERLTQLPSLEYLRVFYCFELKCLSEGLTQLPSLEQLHIEGCDKLESLPEELGQLNKLKILKIIDLDALRCVPDSVGQLQSLEHLEIHNLRKLKSLPDSLGELKALISLEIGYCPALASLPQGLSHLSILQELEIYDCPLLSKRCKREGGMDWPNISHIPNIYINNRQIQ